MKVVPSCWSLLLGWTGFAIVLALPARAETSGDRYNIIFERKPFGSTAADSAQAGMKPVASFADSLRLSAICELNSKYWVGLIDLQANQSLMLTVGQSDGGVELVSVDAAKEEAVVRKNGETGLLRLESGAPSPAAPVPIRLPTSGRPASTGVPPPPPLNATATSTDPGQLRIRREKLLAEMRERIESQRAAQAQGNATPAGLTTRTMVISSPAASGRVTISSSDGGTANVTIKVNGEAVDMSE